jgi:hypothetical protein
MDKLISTSNVDNLVSQVIEQEATEHVKDFLSNTDLASVTRSTMDQYIQLAIRKHLSTIDFPNIIREATYAIVGQNIKNVVFPDASIPATAINFQNFTFSGAQVRGGIHAEFGSTGIDDQATDCVLSIMDDFVVVENTLLANSATVKETLIVEGDLIVKGDINTDSKGFQRLVNFAAEKTKLDIKESMMDNFAEATIAKFKEEGIEASKLTIRGKMVLDDEGLSKAITKSNLQKVGVLQELQVKGETILGDTLYIGNKRAGVNTLEPSRAWSVWEDECETVMGKYEKNTGYIGSVRNQRVVLGSNNNVNIVLETDGATKVIKLKLGNVHLNSVDEMPNWSGHKGDIYFNEVPEVGAPMGWVCLGDSRWAQLPKITE